MTPDKPENEKPDESATTAESDGAADQGTNDAQPPEQAGHDDAASNETPDPAPKPRRGLMLAAIALSLMVLAAVGYVGWQLRSLTGVPDVIAKSRDELGSFTSRLDRLESANDSDSSELEALSSRIERQQRSIEELNVRSNRIERSVEDLPGVADEARSAWLLAEAEYYLRIANSQLSLASNVEVASMALRLADEKLRDLADPRLTPVREKISDEIAALAALPKLDRPGIALTLQSLARSLDSMPLRQARPPQYKPDTETPDNEQAGMDRAIQSVKDAFSSIVSVKRTEDEMAPELSADDRALLIRSMELELQLAKLAFLRNQGDLYRQSLQQVREMLNRSFDIGSSRVQSALGTIGELEQVEIAAELPEIAGSLTLLTELATLDANP